MLYYYPTFTREQVLIMSAMYRYRWVRACQDSVSDVVEKVDPNGQLDLVDLVTTFVDTTDQMSELSEVLVYWRRCCVTLESIQVQLLPEFRDRLIALISEDYTEYRGTSETSQAFVGKLVEAQPTLRATLMDAPLMDPSHLQPQSLPSGITPDTLN